MKHALIVATAISFALTGAAAADPGKGKGQGKHSGGQVARSVDHSRAHAVGAQHDVRGHNAMANGAWTPPGLAKKPYGMPPGQAKKMWSQGERLPNQYYSQQRYYVANPSAYDLAPAPYGQRWVQVGGNYYLTRTDTGVVSQVVAALLR
ncbi:RcnB family protein [Phenylobacterium sp.]|uniref:RcnB family protein n=1 Tax=Phenylobacterium sp. TaxID=1871053 RepID=UPI003983CE4A